MAAPVPPGAQRPNNPQNSGPPNFVPGSQGNPNSLAANMQNLNINRPPPPMPGSGPRPSPPFGQSPQPFPQSVPPYGGQQQPRPSPMARPGPPPPAAMGRPGGPPQVSQPGGFPSNFQGGRPAAPPSSQSSFGSRPSTGPLVGGGSSFPQPGGFSASGPPSGARSIGFGSPPPTGPGMSLPSPYGMPGGPLNNGPPPSGMPGGPLNNGRPPSGMSGGPLSNGPPPMMGPGAFPRGSQFTSGAMMAPPPPYGQPPNARPLSGNSPLSSPPAHSMPPPSTFPGAPYGRPPMPGPFPYGAPPQQVPSAPGTPGSTYGMGPMPNQLMTSVATPSKIDLNQIPRPGSSSSPIVFETRVQNQANPPPPTTVDYITRDTGNCSPRYMRCTINQIPCTVDLLSTSGMPLALIVQPMALSHPSEEPIQVVDFGESGPVRCSRCKGYVNPFMKFIDQGRKFICNLCGYTDETPRDYQCNLGPDGRRRDADERPELCRGTVDFVATKEYMVRDPMPAVYFFLIDVSMNAIQTGATAAACSAIQQVLSDLPAAFLAMKSTGGKLMVFQSVLPSVGIGALSSREADGRANSSANEREAHKLLQPADKTLRTMAIEFAE